MSKKLPLKFYRRDTVKVAKDLLGKKLVRIYRGRRLSGIIVEVEAYLGSKDKAAHTYGGRRTARNEAMYLAGGHAYVYFVYGMHFCLNVVTKKKDEPEAVLIRALEPVEGIEIMRRCRGVERDRNLTNGPGKLCQSLKIDRRLNGADLTDDILFIEDTGFKLKKKNLGVSRRIGVDYADEAKHWLLRFHIKGNGFVSKKV